MKPGELLRACAERLEKSQKDPGMVLVHPRYCGRFPFAGGGTELLSTTESGSNYWVPVHRILSGVAKMIKLQSQERARDEAYIEEHV